MRIKLAWLVICALSTVVSAQNLDCKPDPLNRTQILDNNDPSSYTCYMEMRRGWTNTTLGTGILIHPRVVLTAGHNTAFFMFSKSFPFVFSSVKNVTLYFGSTDEDNYIIKQNVRLKKGKTKFFSDGYWLSPKIEDDFSIIILPDDSVYRALGGHFIVKPMTSETDIDGPINITGSPGDKDKFQIWTAHTNNFAVNGSKLSYDIFTAPRNSGSPIWFKNANNEYQIAGVHSRGTKGIGCNSAVFINKKTYDTIVEWCATAGIDFE
ncbi:hypothetical protein [uncultured Psychroserpens sp.]|uniref:trypsin-like serine peptidase n=1 Tax=uncultured Psychroserpens sp. TaxID=255436 RepID=UPI00262AA63E|nr:hypothetical protein [uncultured Psychroserpens sp.]